MLIEFTKVRAETNEYKFWRIGAVVEGPGGRITVRREWGRIGTKGSFKDDGFATRVLAERFIEENTRAKLSEGYERLSPLPSDPAWRALAVSERRAQARQIEKRAKRAEVKPVEPPPLRRIMFDE